MKRPTHSLWPIVAALAAACGPSAVEGSMPLPAAPPSNAARVHALLINGGHSEDNNYLSHVEHVRGMVEVLGERGIGIERLTIFASDGRDEGEDLVVRDPDRNAAARWLLEGTPLERRLRPQRRSENTVWPAELAVEPATRQALRRWFDAPPETLGAGDILLIYVTDHGNRGDPDPANATISLWNEVLPVSDFRAWLTKLPDGVQVVLVMSQCFSGAFADAVLSLPAGEEPNGEACGFFAVPADRPAYGCYPEGRAQDDGQGHGYVFIDQLGRQDSLDESHLETLVADATPDIPLRTSDLYLESLVRAAQHAANAEDDAWVDVLLATAQAATSEQWQLVQELAEAYGLPAVDTLSELRALRQDVEALEEALQSASRQWDSAADALSRANFEAFVDASPLWRVRLAAHGLTGLDDAARASLADELVPALEAFTRDRRNDVWTDLRHMREQADRAQPARWRQTVRLAVIERMRFQLLGLAGLTLLERDAANMHAERGAYEALRACEQLPLGTLATPAVDRVATPAFEASLSQDRALLDTVIPARLGISYEPTSDETPGRVLVSSVLPDSAAARAGLRPGDLVVGPPGTPFAFTDDIKRWTITAPRGAPLELEILRDGRAQVVTVELPQ